MFRQQVTETPTVGGPIKRHAGYAFEDHGQPSQPVGQTVPSIANDLCNVRINNTHPDGA